MADVSIGDSDLEDQPDSARALTAAPPWLVSLILHMVVLLVLGLVFIPGLVRDEIQLEGFFAEEVGGQLEDPTVQVTTDDSATASIVTAEDLTAVDEPLPSLPTVQLDLGGNLSSADPGSPRVSLALSGREEGMREALLVAYGGDATTEASVALGLAWLARNQMRPGYWSLQGPYRDGAPAESRLAATAMALLAFQGAGFTHQSGRPFVDAQGNKQQFRYEKVVDRGWQAMLDWQDADGSFWKEARVEVRHHRLYSQAQATIAICELFGMTRDEAFRQPAQRAVDYAVRIQDTLGGWRYEPGTESDTSVTGWFVMALQSARMAGLDVPSDTLDKVSKFLDMVTDDGGSRYGYLPGMASKPSMTAEALLCRQYLGWRQDDPRLVGGVRYLDNYPIDWSDPNTYYWYYATQVMHHAEGDAWQRWNRVMRQEIPRQQVQQGREQGSWEPGQDRWASQGGRLYMTCLCIYMLEVYYRHLPIYAQVYAVPGR
jgi:hypothetical protein